MVPIRVEDLENEPRNKEVTLNAITDSTGNREGGGFATTHWSLVLRAGDPRATGSEDALGKLYETYAYRLSDAGRWLAAVGRSPSDEGTIFLWDARTGRQAATLRGHTRRIQGLRFSPDNRWLASGSADETARIWDLSTFRESAILRGAANAVTVLSFSRNGRTLATGGWDGVLRLWSIPDGALLRTTPRWESPPVPEFMPDGNSLAIMVEHTGIRLYHLEARRDTSILRWPGARPYRYLRCSPDGQIIATQSQDGRVKLWHAPAVDEFQL